MIGAVRLKNTVTMPIVAVEFAPATPLAPSATCAWYCTLAVAPAASVALAVKPVAVIVQLAPTCAPVTTQVFASPIRLLNVVVKVNAWAWLPGFVS